MQREVSDPRVPNIDKFKDRLCWLYLAVDALREIAEADPVNRGDDCQKISKTPEGFIARVKSGQAEYRLEYKKVPGGMEFLLVQGVTAFFAQKLMIREGDLIQYQFGTVHCSSISSNEINLSRVISHTPESLVASTGSWLSYVVDFLDNVRLVHSVLQRDLRLSMLDISGPALAKVV